MSDTTIDKILAKFEQDYASEHDAQDKLKSALYDLILKEVVGKGIDTSAWPDDVPATDIHYAHGFNTCWDRTKTNLERLFGNER